MNACRQETRVVRARGEHGVTLTELLIAMVITATIIGPIGASIFFGLRTNVGTQDRIAEAASANVMASYFVPDVQGSTSAMVNVAEDAAACGSGATQANLVLTTSPTSSVSYVQGTGAKANVLYRRTCSGGGSTGLARVAVMLAQPPDFACNNGACGDSFDSIIATVVQRDVQGKSEYQTRLEAARRSG